MFKQQLYATPLNHAGADFFFFKKKANDFQWNNQSGFCEK
jgi:hypothetical protein